MKLATAVVLVLVWPVAVFLLNAGFTADVSHAGVGAGIGVAWVCMMGLTLGALCMGGTIAHVFVYRSWWLLIFFCVVGMLPWCIELTEQWQEENRIADESEYYALHIALAKRQFDKADSLVRSGFPLDRAESDNRDLPFHIAVRVADDKLVALFLERNAPYSVDGRSALAERPLVHDAALNSSPAILELLADHGFDLGVRNADGKTAVDVAIIGTRGGRGVNPQTRLVNADFLLAKGVPVGDEDHWARPVRKGQLKVMRFLLRHRIPVPQTQDGRDDLLQLALEYSPKEEKKEVVEFLLKSELVDINHRGNRDSRSVHAAVDTGNLELVLLVLAHGANPNAQSNGANGRETALHRAIYHPDPQLIGALLSAGADPNIDEGEYTPLEDLIRRGSLKEKTAIKQLLKGGANPDRAMPGTRWGSARDYISSQAATDPEYAEILRLLPAPSPQQVPSS